MTVSGPETVGGTAGVTSVGVIGAGQLALMLGEAAAAEGIALHVLAGAPDEPGARLAAGVVLGTAADPLAVGRLAATCDVITVEHELVDLDLLRRLAATGVRIAPSPEVLAAVVDKIAMRQAVLAAGVPVPPWCAVTDLASLEVAVARWPRVVLKAARGGYDGRGVHLAVDADDARIVGRAMLAGSALVVEPRLDFEAEIAVVACRRPGGDEGGETVVWAPVRTEQVDGQCRQVAWPAGLSGQQGERAQAIARHLASALDVVGLLAVELFLVDGELVVNELAVRPHNTAHHTIEAARTSQFTAHLRAVLDRPIGDVSPTCGAAVMVNVIGDSGGRDPRAAADVGDSDITDRDITDRDITDPDVDGPGITGSDVDGLRTFVHLYGKAPRPERKLGHVTVTASSPDQLPEATARAWAVVDGLGASLVGAPAGAGR